MQEIPTISPKGHANARLNNPAMAMVILLGLFMFFMIVTPLLAEMIAKLLPDHLRAVRIAMVLQDIFVFVLPAIVTALVVTRLPARLLGVDRLPGLMPSMWAVLAWLASVPAMNALVRWNESWQFPLALHELELTMHQMEDQAKAMIDSLMQGASVGSLIVSVLIIGVLAGFSEEIFFRGALQRILMAGKRMNPHVAIWITATVFSLLHFQIFGFVPRLLLGAFFGYLLFWTGSLWLPILLHTLNNTMVVIIQWFESNNHDAASLAAHIGEAPEASSSDLWATLISILATILFLILLRRQSPFPS